MSHYFYIDSHQKQQGPIDASQLLNHGCNLYTFVWTAGMSDWKQAKDVQELSILFSNQGNNKPSPGISNSSDMTFSSTKVEFNDNLNYENTCEHSFTKAFLHLLYAILWFIGAGLIVWALIWFFTESKGGRIKVMAFFAPLYFIWYGLKEIGCFFKELFN